MPEFVTRPTDYDLSLAGPFSNRGVTMHLHVLEADILGLWKTLQRYLNRQAAGVGRFLPIGNRIVIACTDIQEGRAGDATLGSQHEVEVAFLILAVQCDPLPRRIVSFAPYLFVNNAWAMSMGREVHGFRKDLATSFTDAIDVDGPEWRNDPGDIQHVETWAMRERGEASRLERMKLLRIRHTDGDRASGAGLADIATTLIGSGCTPLVGEVRDADLISRLTARGSSHVADLLGDLTSGMETKVPMAFLRQFRDPRRSRLADVQEVLTGTAIGTLTSAPSRRHPSAFLFEGAASHPIAHELGLSNGHWLRSQLSLEVSLDFVFHDAD